MQNETTNEMVLDTRATQHFFKSFENLTNTHPSELTIHTANGKTISHEKGDYNNEKMKLKDVHVVPSCTKNLIVRVKRDLMSYSRALAIKLLL